jgi:hypothetical protein
MIRLILSLVLASATCGLVFWHRGHDRKHAKFARDGLA